MRPSGFAGYAYSDGTILTMWPLRAKMPIV